MAVGRKTGGRVRGVPNKATADIKALAQVHAATAMTELARLATAAESEAARVAAIKELFDRGFGKARQPITGDDDAPPIQQVIRWANSSDEATPDPSTR
jgi:hypothetical protein